ncbi:MAG: zinc-dependent alcohol dehydrogenase family protein, partial [Bryobacteraceae bacterium]
MKLYEIQEPGKIDSLVETTRPDPVPGPGQALVKVKAVSLNYRDLLMAKGGYGRNVPLPLVPLSDGAGEVAAVGPGVARVKAGDRVAGIFMQAWIAGELTEAKARSAMGGAIDGMFAEQVVLSEEGLVRIPPHLSFEEAATLPCAAVTAWHALILEGGLRPGETVLLLGTGGVSMFALQFAKLSGARIIATSSSDEKLDRARKMGAHETINYRKTPDWDKAVRELTGGVGVDHVVEVGGAGTLGRSVKAVRMNGRVLLIGVLAGGADFNPNPVLMRNIRLQGIYVGSREMFEGMNRALETHQIRPVVDRVFTFDRAHDAYRYMES